MIQMPLRHKAGQYVLVGGGRVAVHQHSRTAEGSQQRFRDDGVHSLKGIDGLRQVFTLEPD